MMDDNKGFIATSLIYSFFLVFIAILAALLSNFISSKTILERYNTEIINHLNDSTYTLKVQATNTNIQDGMTLSNLVVNGKFANGETYWLTENCPYTFSNTIWDGKSSSAYKSGCSETNGRLIQNIDVLNNNIYYYSLRQINNSTNNTSKMIAYLDNANAGFIDLGGATTWKRMSNIYTSTSEGEIRLVIGENASSYTGTTRYTDVMVLNLTASFGTGYEPDASWIDENIEWFDGTISYIRMDNIENNSSAKVKFNLYSSYRIPTVNCTTDDEKAIKVNATMSEPRQEDDRWVATLTVNKVNENTKCIVGWSEI